MVCKGVRPYPRFQTFTAILNGTSVLSFLALLKRRGGRIGFEGAAPLQTSPDKDLNLAILQ